MAGVREDQHAISVIEHAVERGHELVAIDALVEQRVHLAHDGADRELVADLGEQDMRKPAMMSAAGMPLPATSAIASPSRESVTGMKS